MKKVIVPILILAFVATIPALVQNSIRVSQVKKELKEVLKMAEQICDSGCTDYPDDWVIPGQEAEAELYCMRQCANNMKGMKEGLLEEYPVLYTKQYNYRVAQLYCILGLVCPTTQVDEYVRNF